MFHNSTPVYAKHGAINTGLRLCRSLTHKHSLRFCNEKNGRQPLITADNLQNR